MKQPANNSTLGSIKPATPMPQASVSSTVEPASQASSIPVNPAATNPAPSGLSLSLEDDVVPASAEVPVELPSMEEPASQQTFSVLETID